MTLALTHRPLTVGRDTFPLLEAGRGDPIVFLHGALGEARTWRRQLEHLADRFHALAYTQRGFGDLTWRADGPPFGTGAHADDLIAVIEALGLGPVSLVAWSYAGHAALAALHRRPELFARALIYEPGVPSYVTDPAPLEQFGRDAQAMFGPVFEASARGDLEAAVRHLIDGSGGPGAFDAQSDERRAIELANAHTMPALLAQAPPPHLGCEDLAALRSPVTIAWGARTRPVFAIPSRAAAACIANARHVEVPDVGHLWPDEAPIAFADLVATWMNR